MGYGSDEEINDTDRRGNRTSGPRSGGASRRKDDDTNYDDVNMDLSEDSQQEESEPELPQAENTRHSEQDGRRSRDSSHRDSNSDSSERRRDSPSRYKRDRSPRRDDKRSRHDRNRYEGPPPAKKGLLGDRPGDNHKVPPLMDVNPFGGEARSHDTRDAVSPRFIDRNRRDRDRERERDRYRRSEERSSRRGDRRSRSRDRGERGGDKYKPRNAYPPPESLNAERGSPSGSHYHTSSSYKVNKKLDVMEKMGLQIKTPDGSMTTAQQLRQAATEPGGLPSYCSANNPNASRIMDQVQKRKLLWSNKNKSTPAEAGTWSGTKFAQDNDGKQAEKFMRLMGIKEPVRAQPEKADRSADPIKKQEEMFQAMQAQYEVARATTHTMRGVGLGFQRGQF